jgi:hypothetical protein
MAVFTSQRITAYYEKYRSIEVTYTKDIIRVTGMVPQQIHLKCGGDFWPCVIYSSSFEGAKIVANTSSGILNKLQAANNAASLRFCFTNPDANQPLTFFVGVRVTGNSPYRDSKDMASFTLQFTQRPPDDLIQIMGRLLDANVNSVKRKNAWIALAPENIRRLKILLKDISVFIQNVPRPCVLRELSFIGAKIIIRGVAKFLIEKESALRIDFEDPRESFLIKGKLIAAEPVEGRQDLLVVNIEFAGQLIPLGYKIRLNDFLSQVWADTRSNDRQNAINDARKTAPAVRPPAAPKSPAKAAANTAGEADTKEAAKPGGTAAPAANAGTGKPPALEKIVGEPAPATAE